MSQRLAVILTAGRRLNAATVVEAGFFLASTPPLDRPRRPRPIAAMQRIAVAGIKQRRNRHHLPAAPAPAMECQARHIARHIEKPPLCGRRQLRYVLSTLPRQSA